MRTNSNKNTIKIIDLKILKDLFCLQIDIIDYWSKNYGVMNTYLY